MPVSRLETQYLIDLYFLTLFLDRIEPPSHWPHPHARVVKAFVYMFDVAEDQGCTSVVRGSHLMPTEWGSAGAVYNLSSIGLKGFGGSSKGRTVDDGYALSDSIANNVKFAARAGDCCIFDIASASQNMPTAHAHHESLVSFSPLRGLLSVHCPLFSVWKLGTLRNQTQMLHSLIERASF